MYEHAICKNVPANGYRLNIVANDKPLICYVQFNQFANHVIKVSVKAEWHGALYILNN